MSRKEMFYTAWSATVCLGLFIWWLPSELRFAGFWGMMALSLSMRLELSRTRKPSKKGDSNAD